MLLVEDLEAAVRRPIAVALRPRGPNPSGTPLIAFTSAWKRRASSHPERKSTHVRVARKGGSVVASKRSGSPGRRTGNSRKLAVMRGSVERDLELLQLPVAEVVRSDEDGTRRGRVHTLGELPLPAPARSQAPRIEPRLEPGPLQPLGRSARRRACHGRCATGRRRRSAARSLRRRTAETAGCQPSRPRRTRRCRHSRARDRGVDRLEFLSNLQLVCGGGFGMSGNRITERRREFPAAVQEPSGKWTRRTWDLLGHCNCRTRSPSSVSRGRCGRPPRSGGGPQSASPSLQHVRSAVRGRDPTTRPRRPLGRYLWLHDGTWNVRRRRLWPQDPLPPTHDRRGHSRRSTRRRWRVKPRLVWS